MQYLYQMNINDNIFINFVRYSFVHVYNELKVISKEVAIK